MLRRIFIILLPILLLNACSDAQKGEAERQASSSISFLFLDGKSGSLEDLKGKWTFVNFWSISCPPCYKEMPDLVKLYDEFKSDDFELIGVAMSYDRPDLVIDTKEKHQLNYPISLDLNDEIDKHFGPVKMIPTTMLLDPHGQVVNTHVGLVTYQQLKTMLLEHRAAYKKGT